MEHLMKGYVDIAGGRVDLFDFSTEIAEYIRRHKPSRIIIGIRLIRGRYLAKIYIPRKDWNNHEKTS